jgi:hypothetical protein
MDSASPLFSSLGLQSIQFRFFPLANPYHGCPGLLPVFPPALAGACAGNAQAKACATLSPKPGHSKFRDIRSSESLLSAFAQWGAGVGKSADAARTSACATFAPRSDVQQAADYKAKGGIVPDGLSE